MSRRRRTVGFLASLLLLTGVMVASLATPASAACEGDPPTPSHPYGLLGLGMTGAPKWGQIPDKAPDPFTDKDTDLVDVYGYGYQWGTYDLGCGSDVARDPFAVLNTQISNLGWVVPTTAGVMVSSLRKLSVVGPFDFLEPLIGSVQGTIRDRLWTTWFPIALIASGVVMLFRARRADYSSTARTLGWVGLVLVVSAFFLQAPTTVDRFISNVMTRAVTTASAPFGTATIEEQISREVLYPQWLQGELGSTTGPTADAFGPRLLAATHYTWSDEKEMATDPDARARIDKAKATQFRVLAKELKDKDPSAYSYLIGKQGESRLTAVMFAGLLTLGLALFVILGFIVLALAQLIARVFIIGFPLAGLMAVVHPRGQFAVVQLWSLFTAAFLAAVKFALVTGLYTLFAAGVMKAPISGLAQLGALLLLTILGLMFARPIRSFKTIVPGLDPNHSYTMGGLRRLTNYATTESAVQSGVVAGTAAAAPAAKAKVRSEEESLSPLPRAGTPAGTSGQATVSWVEQGAGSAQAEAGWRIPSAWDEAPVPLTNGRVAATPALGPAPVAVQGQPVTPRHVRPDSARRPVGDAAPDDGHVLAPVIEPQPAGLAPRVGRVGTGDRAGSAARVRASSGRDPMTAEPLYARPASHVSESVTSLGDLVLADKQVDADGREVFVIYHRGDRYAGAS